MPAPGFRDPSGLLSGSSTRDRRGGLKPVSRTRLRTFAGYGASRSVGPVSLRITRAGAREYGCESTVCSVLIFWMSAGARTTEQAVRDPRQHPCAGGGIGRRAGFRFQCPKGRGGSTPPRAPCGAGLHQDESPGGGPLLVVLRRVVPWVPGTVMYVTGYRFGAPSCPQAAGCPQALTLFRTRRYLHAR